MVNRSDGKCDLYSGNIDETAMIQPQRLQPLFYSQYTCQPALADTSTLGLEDFVGAEIYNAGTTLSEMPTSVAKCIQLLDWIGVCKAAAEVMVL